MRRNWIERRHRREQLLADAPVRVWSELASAIEETVNSFNSRYGGSTTTERKNGRALQVRHENAIIDIHLNLTNRTIEVSCVEPCRSQTFSIDADDEDVFIVDAKRQRLTADAISERVFKDVFFPGEIRRLGVIEYLTEEG